MDSLTEIVEQWRLAADGDLRNRAFLEDAGEAARERMTAAWAVSDDPFAMLLFLAVIHTPRNVPMCDALGQRMSFYPPMRRVVELQAQARPGMNYNGTSRFTFIYLAQRVRQSLRETPPHERVTVAASLAAAIREVVPDPYTLDSGPERLE